MEGVALGLLAAASFGLLMTKKSREGFLVSNDAAALFGNQRTANVETSSKKYNPLMSLMSPGNNPLLPDGYNSIDLHEAEQNVRGALGGAKAEPVDPSFNYKQSYTADLRLNPNSKGTNINTIKMCESAKTIDCSKFDNPDFKNSCGMCFEDGKNSSGMPSIGGLYVSEDDKDNAIYNAKKLGLKRVDQRPSVGTCKSKRFVTTKEECIRLQKQFECEKKQNFEVPGCSQCFQDGTFQYIDADSVTKDTAVLVLAGKGSVSVTKVATQEIVTITLSALPSSINLSSLMEGDQIQLDFKTADSYVAGYISGTTASGSFSMDIVPITLTDLVTNSKPRLTGSLEVNDGSYTVIRPGIGKKSMSLVVTNPFTFISVDQDEAALCASSPYIGLEKSAQLLQSSPCYAKGQRPGNYSKECVQSVFDSAGCTSSGTAYPYNAANAKAISYDKNGKALSVGGIANIVYDMYNTAMLGQDANGEPLEISVWDTASMACLGTHKTSVCDKYDKINGPLGADCLNYLWLNSGASDQLPFGIGSTYTGSTNSASLQAKRGNRFCTSGGSMAPMDEKGNVNQVAVAQAQDKGGVASVTQFYDTISKKANDNAIIDEVRKPFIEQCYGVSMLKAGGGEVKKSQFTLSGKYDSVIDNKPGRTKSKSGSGCITIMPTGERINRSLALIEPRTGHDGNAKVWVMTDLAYKNKLFLVENSSSTGSMSVFDNAWYGVRNGTIANIAYKRMSEDAPAVLKVNIANILIKDYGVDYKDNFFEIPDGMIGSIAAIREIQDIWYAPKSAFSFALTPYDDKYCSSPLNKKLVRGALNGGPIENYGYNLGDIDEFQMSSFDPLICQKACIDNPGCTTWSSVKPGTDPRDRPMCWHKNNTHQPGAPNNYPCAGKIGMELQ
jgi:hypothetical protein